MFILRSHRRFLVLKSVIQEAAALASLAMFVGMVAIWAQVIATL